MIVFLFWLWTVVRWLLLGVGCFVLLVVRRLSFVLLSFVIRCFGVYSMVFVARCLLHVD